MLKLIIIVVSLIFLSDCCLAAGKIRMNDDYVYILNNVVHPYYFTIVRGCDYHDRNVVAAAMNMDTNI